MLRVTTTFSGAYIVGGGITRTYFDTTASTAQDSADAMIAWWTAVRAAMSVTTTITVLGTVEEIDPANGEIQSLESVTGASVSGTSDGAALPPQTQGIVQLRTGDYVDGREVRGRIYIPSLTVSDWQNGNWVSSRRTTIEAANAALLGDADSQVVVWQRERLADPDHLPDPVTHRDGSIWAVTAISLPAKTGVLRSRRD